MPRSVRVPGPFEMMNTRELITCEIIRTCEVELEEEQTICKMQHPTSLH
jgi:hypothetical protein